MSQPDLTRWNRGGLDRFRYIDGNAATYLDDLRLSLLVRYIPDEAFATEDHLAVSWWKELWSDIPDDESALSDLNVLLSDYRAALAWKDLWQALPTESESREKWIERLTEQYHGERREWAWEIVRSLARATHVLVEHIDAYANEGFLGTATQWDNLRRLVAMLDYHPAPPASASTPLALIAKEDAASVVEAGFQVKYAPPDGGPPVIFETLEDLEINPELNELRLYGSDRNPDPLSPLFATPTPWIGLGEANLSAGQVALLIQDSDTSPMQGVVTIGEVVPDEEDPDAGTLVLSSVDSPPPTGWVTGDTRLLGDPREIRRPRMAGENVMILDHDPGLVAGDIVAWKEEEEAWTTATVVEARGAELRLSEAAPPPDTGIVKVATMERPEQGDFRIPAPTGTRTMMVRSAEGELKELTRNDELDTELNDGLVSPLVRLYLESDPIAERGDKEFDPEFGEFFKVTDTATEIVYLIDELQEETEAGVGPVTSSAPADESLMAAPPAAPPPDLPDAEAAFMLEFDGGPGELAAGQWAVGEDLGGGFWPLKIEMIEERDDGFTITAAPTPSTTTIVRLYGAFAGTLRPRGYDINPTPVAGSTLTPADGVDPLLVPGRHLLIEHDPPAEFGMPMEATVQSADPPNGTFTLDRGLTGADGFTVGNTVIRGNVVTAGHGESKPEQVLGSGDAARSNQSFVFEVEDVSFVADPAQSAGVRAAISVVVGNRTYTQVSDLANSGPADPSYTVRMTEDGYLRITFGDGRNGRRLETGTSNVRVSSFRVGTGPTGNGIGPGGLTKPVRPHYLVDEVRQPLPSIGGNAMEDVTSLRKNAPAGLLTLGRAVSHGDFARLAAAQSSVWHANAFVLTGGHGRREAVEVVVVPAGGGELGALEESLTAFLSARALPGMDIKVSPYEAVFPDLAITVRVKSAEYDPEAIVADVRAGLADLLSLRRRRPGQPLYRSEIFEAVESVSGVENSDCIIGGVTAADGAPLERIGRGDNGSIRVAWPTQRQVIYLADVAPVPIAYAEFAL